MTPPAPPSLPPGARALIDTTRSPHACMHMLDLDAVRWTGGLLAERFEVCRRSMVPHLWKILGSEQDSHAWANFLVAAGDDDGLDGHHHGPVFNDGDFLKWFEALVQVHALHPEDGWAALLERIVDVVGRAQRQDGYLHTRTIIPQRQGVVGAREFEDREHFETYNMGHLMTAACLHHRATGSGAMLALARKAADYLCGFLERSSPDLARNAICPSHYMGVVELWRTTREPRYLELARQLIEIRDLVTDGSDHNQDRVPFRRQRKAVGHAVRANYLYAGVADVVAETGDPTLLETLRDLGDDVVAHKLYVTGATGAIYDGASPDGSSDHSSIKLIHQAYGRDWQLPNLTAYNESCATIGYAMWAWRMLLLTGDARQADLFELAFYNGILPTISLDGTHYFYVNALRKRHDFTWPLRWSRTRTPNIPESFCCPPNTVRTIAEVHNYVFTARADVLWVHLYGGCALDTPWLGGGRVRLRQETDYPWDGAVRIMIDEAPAAPLALFLRIPGWLRPGAAQVRVNGDVVDAPATPGTYCELRRRWQAGDIVELDLPMEVVLLEAHPLVEETLNQGVVKRGPIVYCLESNDLPAGVTLDDVALPADLARRPCTTRRERVVNTDLLMLTVPAWLVRRSPWRPGELYRTAQPPEVHPIDLTLLPHYAWGNRGDTEMSVWLPLKP